MSKIQLRGYKYITIVRLNFPITAFLLLSLLYAQVGQIEYFKEGFELYKKGDLQGAYEVLENALKESRELNPDLIRFLVFQLEKDLLVEMIAKGGRLARTAKRILELSKSALEGYKASEEELNKLLLILKDEKSPFDRKHIAINKLILIGKDAIPPLVAGLGDDKNETFRLNSVITLTKFGDLAVIPLITALKTENILQKRNILIVLSNIKNKIAAPFISAIAGDKKEDEGVRSFARDIIKKWFPDRRIPTKTLFSKYAHHILKAPPKLAKDMDDLSSFWMFENGQLKFINVYSFETKYLVAEDYLLRALKIDKTFFPAQVILVLLYTKYYSQVLGYLRTVKDPAKREKLKIVLEKVKKRFESVSGFNLPVIYEALSHAIKKNEYDIAVEIINLLAVMGSYEDAVQMEKGTMRGNILFKSITSVDKPTRFASALTVLKWHPHNDFPNKENWHKVAEEALAEESIWRILLVDKDQRFYTKLKNVSKHLKLNITPVIDPKKALYLARSFPAFDLIIVGFDFIDEIVYSVELAGLNEKGERKKVDIYLLKAFSEDIRLRYSPVIVAVNSEEEKKKIYETVFSVGVDGDVKDIILKNTDANELALKLYDIFTSYGLFAESKNKASEFILEFEKELQNLDISKTSLNWRHIIPQLINIYPNRPLQISIEAIRALGNLLDNRAVSPLIRIANSKSYSFEQRKQSLLSLINILSKYPDSLTEIDINLLFNIVKTAQPRLRELVPKVLGKANIDPKIRLKLVEELKK